MGFRWIRVYQFRNLAGTTVDLDAPEVFLIGENGQGKSNFLEALYFIAFGSSFRTQRDNDVVTIGQETAQVESSLSKPGGLELKASVRIHTRGRKEIRIDDKTIQDRKLLVENTPCIVFSHEDMDFVTGSPERRRWFLNQTASLYNPLFIDTYRQYRRILKNRNAILKQGRTDLIDIYDWELAVCGTDIQMRRRKVVEEYDRTIMPLFQEISGIKNELSIRYKPSWPETGEKDEAVHALHRTRERDREYGTTTTGPHRDDLLFLMNGRSFSKLASKGQIRLLSLMLKVAQALTYTRLSGKKPVLLLDDVLLELDSTKRQKFLCCLPSYEQAFFTFLPDERYMTYRSDCTIMYEVKKGMIFPWKKPAKS